MGVVCANDPVNAYDPLGLAPNKKGATDPKTILEHIKGLEKLKKDNGNPGYTRAQIMKLMRDRHADNRQRYFYTHRFGWVDVRHFFAATQVSSKTKSSVITEGLGFVLECKQWATEWGDDYRSGFSPEDLPSNAAGASFGCSFKNDNEPVAVAFERWLIWARARPRNEIMWLYSDLPEEDPSSRGGKARAASNLSRNKPGYRSHETISDSVNYHGKEALDWRNMERALDPD